MAPRRRRARHRTRYGPERPLQRDRVVRRVQRPAARTCLDDDGGRADRRDEAIAQEEPPARRRRPARQLGHHGSVASHPREELRVTGRIETVDAAREERHRAPRRPDGRAVRRAVDAVRPARDHRHASVDEAGGQLSGDVLAVPGGRARSHDRHGPRERGHRVRRPRAPQHERRVRPQVVRAYRPVRIPGYHHPRADRARGVEPRQRLGPHDAGTPAFQRPVDLADERSAPVRLQMEPGVEHRPDDRVGRAAVDHGGQRRAGAEHADDRPGDAIAGLGDAGPCAARRHLLRIRVARVRARTCGIGAERGHQLPEIARRESEAGDGARTCRVGPRDAAPRCFRRPSSASRAGWGGTDRPLGGMRVVHHAASVVVGDHDAPRSRRARPR